MADEDKTTEQLLEELQAARQEIANARSLADNSRDNIMRYDRQLRHIFVNRAALEVTGISASEALGKTHRELGFPAALCDLWEARIASVFDTGESAQVEFDVELPGGKVWLDLRLHPELDADGGVCSVLAVSRDITDRKHAEESLRQRTAELEALFQASPDLSFRLSSDGTILDFHTGRASDLYTTPDKFLGRRMQDVLPADVGQQFQQAYEQALDGATVSLEYALAVPSGAKVFEARVIPLPDNQVYVLVRDITDRKRAQEERSALEAQLQQAQRLEGLGVLASGIAHDFNNLLVGIYGNMDLALRGLEEGSSTLRYIANAKMAAKRAADLIGQMLTYAGEEKPNTKNVDLSGLVQEMASLLETSVSKKTTFRLELAPDLLPARGDPTQIRQVVMNLLTNAAQAIGEETGEIAVGTEMVECDRAFLNELRPDAELLAGAYICLRISDTGCGVDEETRRRIFDPFFTTKATGSGLGLSAVHGIVRSHGGAIKVESEPGKGSSFMILFPASLQSTDADRADLASKDWLGSGTILLVDDEEMVRQVAAQMLAATGFSVLMASDGIEAVELLRQHGDDTDCILLDSKMPRMSGPETYDEIRKVSQSVPVILSSGQGARESTEQFRGKDLAGILRKPYALAELQDKLRVALGDKHK